MKKSTTTIHAQTLSLIKKCSLFLMISLFVFNYKVNAQSYCIPAGGSCTSTYIDNVTYGTVNNNSVCNPGAYTDYSGLSSDANIGGVLTVNMHMTVSVPSQTIAGVWIDYNHDFAFQSTEFTMFSQSTFGQSQQFSVNIQIPATAQAGITRMRIQGIYNGNVNPANSCSFLTPFMDDTEDYSVNLLSVPCTAPAFISQSNNQSLCEGSTVFFNFVAYGNPTVTYQWQCDNGTNAFTNIPGETLSTLSVSSITNTMNGYQYRCVASNGCSAGPDLTGTPRTLTVNPLPGGSALPQTILSGTASSVALNSTVPNSSFSWTASSISGSATGQSSCFFSCGTTIAQTLTAPIPNVDGVVHYEVTPRSPVNCNGNTFPVDVTITHNSTPPPFGSASPQTICSGSFSSVALNSSVGGTTFTWIATLLSGTTTGFSNCTSGCGTNIHQFLTNKGVVRYTVSTTGPAPGFLAGNTFTVDVTVNGVPDIPIVSGLNAVCQHPNVTYTAVSAGAQTYNWTLPTGMSFTGATNTSSINVNIAAGFQPGNITCTATNGCGTSIPGYYLVTSKPQAPATISGLSSVCGQSSVTYSVPPVLGATSYQWSLPSGLTGIAPVNQNSITANVVSPTWVSATVRVKAINNCGYVTGPNKTVYANHPITPAPISGLSTICLETSSTYTTAGSTGATAYTWTMSGLASVTGNGLSATVNFQPAFTSGVLRVRATNPCGNSSYKTKTITKNCGSAMTAINSDEKSLSIDAESMIGFTLYPNPATTDFNMDITSDEDTDLTIELFDVVGNKVIQQQQTVAAGESSLNIGIESLNDGLYLVRIVDATNKTLYTERIMKQ